MWKNFLTISRIQLKLRENTPLALALNIGLSFLIGMMVLLGFFYIYLPIATHHGESITVPDLEGMTLQQAADFLKERELRYIVTDSSYNPKLPPLTIIAQDPPKNSKVKVNRRIHLVINATQPPMEQLPNIIDNSLKQADQILESYGFKIGEVRYVPDIAANAVLRVFYNGKLITKEQIERGFLLPKGSKIDLEVGDGLGNTTFDLPNLVGKPFAEVQFLLRGMGLDIGNVIYEAANGRELGIVIRQKPAYEPGKKVKTGEIIDLWVTGVEPSDIEN
ncbi:MAG: PASTA domain-containing protein [Cytophagales bacterium]|nr:PASTA domain-containing protein [Bernardetiaceae bacterium]MDW8211188.1 PASTA domain-containing protein [Cytophagales bacterium]